MTTEPIPDNCLPPQEVIEAALKGPKTDANGRILEGVYQGMTWAEVLAARDRFNEMF